MAKFKAQTCIFVFCLFAHCASSPAEDGDKRAKKIDDKDFSGIVKDLSKLIKDISIESFEGDAILEQFVDKLNEATTYKLVGSDKKSASLYERNSNDLEKEVVILLPSEDAISVRKEKRTFIGLRKADKDDKSRYFIFYIYLRKPRDDEIGEKIGSEKKVVEYDLWENRDSHAAKDKDKTLAWNECRPTIFLPCKSSDAPDMAPPRKHKKKKSSDDSDEAKDSDKSKKSKSKSSDSDEEKDSKKSKKSKSKSDSAEEKDSKKPKKFNKIKEKDLPKFKCGGGDDADENVDFFWDIQEDLSRGRAMGGRYINLITGLLGGVLKTANNIVGVAGNLVGGVLQLGIGILGSFAGFGGLGTRDARPDQVGDALAIGGVPRSINDLPDQYEYEAEKEFKNPASGGLGGLLGLEIDLDEPKAPETSTTAKPKKNKKKKSKNKAPADGSNNSSITEANVATGKQGVTTTESFIFEDETTTELTIMELTEGVPGQSTDVADDGTITETVGYGVQEGRGISSFFNAALQKAKKVLGVGEEPTVVDTEPGWKTRDEAGNPNDTLGYESAAFVGFGGCVYKRVSKSDYDVAETSEEVVKVLTTALRTQCVNRDLKSYNGLLEDGILKMNKEKTFDVITSNKYIKMEKLRPRRRNDLSRALELSVFSKAFNEELYSKKPFVTFVNGHGSRRVRTLITALTQGIEFVRHNLRLHEVKLLRVLANTAKIAFGKLLEDDEAMQECVDCALDKKVTLEDKKEIMGLIQFILHGLGNLDKKPKSVHEALEAFKKDNEKAISQRVDSYTN